MGMWLPFVTTPLMGNKKKFEVCYLLLVFNNLLLDYNVPSFKAIRLEKAYFQGHKSFLYFCFFRSISDACVVSTRGWIPALSYYIT